MSPIQKCLVAFFLNLIVICSLGINGYAQCGVYLRHASTQRFSHPRVYLNRAADMTGDGKPDLIATQKSDSSVFNRERFFVIPNNGNGTFGSPTIIEKHAGTPFADHFIVGKVNNDALNDIIAFHPFTHDPGTMMVYLNNGNGTFAAPIVSVGASRGSPWDIVDVNGDGFSDYVGYDFSGMMKYSPGDGAGNLGAPVTVYDDSGAAFNGDFNNDGKRDFVHTRKLFMQNSDGTFTASDMTSLLGSSAMIYIVKDLTGDGRSDILATTSAGLTLLKRTDTTFEATSYPFPNIPGEAIGLVGNFNGDGFTDLVVSYRFVNTKVVFTSDATGNFTQHQYDGRYYYFNFLDMVFADFDGDGDDDAVQSTSKITNGTVMLSDVTSFTFLRNVCDRPGQPRIVEVDGTGNSDYSIWNPATGDWTFRANPYDNETNALQTVNWGLGSHGDIPTPGDFDGDGITDRAVYRDSTGVWWIRRSSDQAWFVLPFGLPGDKPVAADYDGDTITDIAVWRPSNGNWYFWFMGTQQFGAVHFGLDGDKPVNGDFDGDLKTDVAVYRPSTGVWYYLRSSDLSFAVIRWGISTDKPIPGDFDGDGRTDIAVFRESDRVAYIVQSHNSTPVYIYWGAAGDILQIADYDGDYVSDLGAYRPSTGLWFETSGGAFFGGPTSVPTTSLFRYE